MKKLGLTFVLAAAVGGHGAAIADGLEVDVVHFWVSNSEAAALDTYRQAWTSQGNLWLDFPAENKVAVQRVVSERIVSGYPPAVMQWNANQGSRELPEMGIVQDIEEAAREDHWREILPAFVLDRISYEDKIYFAPSNIHAENWLWTSQVLFDELGLDTPESWDDVFHSAEQLQRAGYRPIALGSGEWELSLLFNDLMFHTMGPKGYERILAGDAEAILEPPILEALDMMRRVSRYTDTPSARAGMTWADATAQVGRGEAGMQFMGDWAKGELIKLGYAVDKDFGCTLAPGTSIAYFMVIDAFAFPLTSREGSYNSQQAFARMVLDRDNQVAFSRVKGSLPARTDVDADVLDRCGRLGLRMLSQDEHRVSAQSMAMPSQMSEGWIGILSDFFNDPDMTSETAQQRLYHIVSQR